jgi:hypothetical protein
MFQKVLSLAVTPDASSHHQVMGGSPAIGHVVSFSEHVFEMA